MSDEKLRELERRWKETGSVEDEAGWLKERVRTGDLGKEQLELAAYCGYEPARNALGLEVSTPSADPIEWLEGLADSKQTLLVRALVAGVRATLPHWETSGEFDWVGMDCLAAPRRLVFCVDEWLSCPCSAHARACNRMSESTRIECSPVFGLHSLWAAIRLANLVGKADIRGEVKKIASHCWSFLAEDTLRSAVLEEAVAGLFRHGQE